MKIIKYKKDFEYSYSLGAFPTIELLENKNNKVLSIYIHSSFKNEEVLNKISKLVGKDKIFYDDKIFQKLNEKDNTFIIGVFEKYKSILELNEDHVILDNISNMGNLGTIIRSCLGFEIKNIALIGNNIDIFDPKVIRSSMGAIFKINIQHFKTLEEYRNIHKNHLYPFMLNAKHELTTIKFSKDCLSLVFGNESSGLDEEIYKGYDSIVIKHSKNIDSLNITNATSIALYEYHKQRGF